jgi:hypothetical protein
MVSPTKSTNMFFNMLFVEKNTNKGSGKYKGYITTPAPPPSPISPPLNQERDLVPKNILDDVNFPFDIIPQKILDNLVPAANMNERVLMMFDPLVSTNGLMTK